MSSKASILKKFRRFFRRIEGKNDAFLPASQTLSKSSVSVQVGKLLKDRGGEVITMTTL